MENSETSVCLDFALACEYITYDHHQTLTKQSEEVGKLINFMILNPKKFGSMG